MPLTRRMFAQLVVSALLLRRLPAFAQTPLTVAIGDSPKPEVTQRVVSAGTPANMLLLAVAPEKVVGFSSLDFSCQTATPFHDDIRTLPKLGRLVGRASTLSFEALLALEPCLSYTSPCP